MAEAPCRVRHVVVRGNEKTHASVIRQEFRHAREARTLGEISQLCASGCAQLHSLRIFDSADVLCDSAGVGPDGAPLADIVVTVSEKKRLSHASTGVHTSSGEGSMDASVTVRNLLGHAEEYNMVMEAGHQRSNAFKLQISKPRWLGRDIVLAADFGKQTVSRQKHSSFDEKSRGGKLSCTMGNAEDPAGCHDFSYELSLREVCKLPMRTASWSILEQRGLSVKSAISHTYTRSSLDNPVMPTSGSLLRLSTELAGFPAFGDALFHKQQVEVQRHVPLLPQWQLALHLSARGGLLMPLGTTPRPVTVVDRFFLGGPNSLWGFRTNGVGPREMRHTQDGRVNSKTPRDALGGDVLGVATIGLSCCLPGKLKEYGVRGQVFASAGSLQSISEIGAAGAAAGGSMGTTARAFTQSMRATVGAGLVIPTAFGRVEINLSHVLRRQAQDSIQRSGLQIGVSGSAV